MPIWNEELQQWGYLYYEEVFESEWLGLTRHDDMGITAGPTDDPAAPLPITHEPPHQHQPNGPPAHANPNQSTSAPGPTPATSRRR
jgi:hypothetical protein